MFLPYVNSVSVVEATELIHVPPLDVNLVEFVTVQALMMTGSSSVSGS